MPKYFKDERPLPFQKFELRGAATTIEQLKKAFSNGRKEASICVVHDDYEENCLGYINARTFLNPALNTAEISQLIEIQDFVHCQSVYAGLSASLPRASQTKRYFFGRNPGGRLEGGSFGGGSGEASGST